jgi:hypothetical protein
MTERVPICEIVTAYSEYVALAEALGMEVNKGGVRRHALRGQDYTGDMKSFFSVSYSSRYPGRTAPVAVFKAVADLRRDLASTIMSHLNGQYPSKDVSNIAGIIQAAGKLPAAKVQQISCEVRRGHHAEFLKAGEVPIAEVHAALRKYSGDQTVARAKLVEYIRVELDKLGVDMSVASIEERLRKNTKVRTVPGVMLDVVRTLGGDFRSGLVHIESLTGDQDPVQWLANCQHTLGLRSKNAMHKALAQATGVHYETVHKALTNPRAGQRIRMEIRDTLIQWLEKSKRGEPLPFAATSPARNADHHAAAARPILRRLVPFYRHDVQLMCQEASQVMGVGVDIIRRVYDGGPNGCMTDEGIGALRRLLTQKRNSRVISSYLRDRAIRKTALQLSDRVESARRAWEESHDDDQHSSFKRLRLRMIMAIKEGRSQRPEELPEEGMEDIEDTLDPELSDVL